MFLFLSLNSKAFEMGLMASTMTGLKRKYSSTKQSFSFIAFVMNVQVPLVMSLPSMLSILSVIFCSSAMNRMLAGLDDNFVLYIPYSGKVWWAECLANLLFSSIWWKKVWRINRSAKGLSMVTTNLDGFSLANRRRFTKFAKLSPCQTFPLYDTQYF